MFGNKQELLDIRNELQRLVIDMVNRIENSNKTAHALVSQKLSTLEKEIFSLNDKIDFYEDKLKDMGILAQTHADYLKFLEDDKNDV